MVRPPNQACFDPRARTRLGISASINLCSCPPEQCTRSHRPSKSFPLMFLLALSLSTCCSPNSMGVPCRYVSFTWPGKLPSTVSGWHAVGALNMLISWN